MKAQTTEDARQLWEYPVQLPTDGTTSGQIQIRVPFPAEYMGVLNSSAATFYIANGTPSIKPDTAKQFNDDVYLSVPIQKTQQLTLFWTAPSGGLSSNNANALLLFSNLTIAVQGGSMTTGGVSQNVSVTNTPTVNVNSITSTSNVAVTSLPAIQGSDYGSPAANHTAKVDANGLLHVSIESDTDTLAKDGTDATGVVMPTGGAGIRGWLSGLFNLFYGGTAKITVGTDSVGLAKDSTLGTVNTSVGTVNTSVQGTTSAVGKLAQAASAGPITQPAVSVATTITPILNNVVVNAKTIQIQNLDASNPVFLGDSTVTGSIAAGNKVGIKVPPGATFSYDIQPGTNQTLYGIATGAAVIVALGYVN